MTLKRKIIGYLLLIGFSIIYIFIVLPVQNSYFERIYQFRNQKNHFVKNSEDSPLEEEQLKDFKKLKYFPIDKHFKKEAGITLYKQKDTLKLQILRSQKETDFFIKYGKIVFEHKNEIYQLDFFKHINDPKQTNRYFIPFYDLSNNINTYKNGRYLDFKIDTSKVIQTIDFNLTYNPFCAYNRNYKCPIPPKTNFLPFMVDAGEMNF